MAVEAESGQMSNEVCYGCKGGTTWPSQVLVPPDLRAVVKRHFRKTEL